MAYFPSQIMPKRLMPETVREVDDSPAIYNARDYNIHLRELIAIERFLVGDGLSAASGNTGIVSMLNALAQAFNSLSKNGTILQTSGVISTVGAGDQPPHLIGTVPLPAGLANTYTRDAVSKTDTTIPVVSVKDFPTSGYITKFNSVKAGGYPFGFTSMSSQEVISYASVDTVTNEFLGCTRAILGTAQDVPSGISRDTNPALIVAGRASVFLAHKGWQTAQPTGGGALVTNAYIDHDASLMVSSAVYDNASNTMDESHEIIYSLTVSGTFENIKVLESA